MSEYSEYSKTSRNSILSWRPDVCVYVRVCSIFNVSNPNNSSTAWDINTKFGTPVKQSQPFNRDYFHDNWCPICDFIRYWIFWKSVVVTLTFVKLELTSWKYTQISYIDQGTLVLNLAKIDWSVQIFFRFWIFWEFCQNCLTPANFDLSSFVRKCINTEWRLTLNFVKISRDL